MGKKKSFRKTAKVIETAVNFLRSRSQKTVKEVAFPQTVRSTKSKVEKATRDDEMDMLFKLAQFQQTKKAAAVYDKVSNIIFKDLKDFFPLTMSQLQKKKKLYLYWMFWSEDSEQ